MFRFLKKNSIPTTELELSNWMKKNCYNFECYSINGNSIIEGYGIDKIGGRFIWYYTEKGEKRVLKEFPTEEELVQFAFNKIQSDEWANTHCIGFVEDKRRHLELANKLSDKGIKFIQDQIPYYGESRPIHRTFVIGCDVNRVKNLKRKYFETK